MGDAAQLQRHKDLAALQTDRWRDFGADDAQRGMPEPPGACRGSALRAHPLSGSAVHA
jgi:hypothetical protein